MTDRITAALEAADKATPGQWCPHYIHDLLRIGRKSLDITTDCDCLYEPDENDATLIAAAPDLAEEVVRLRRLLKECADRGEAWYLQGVPEPSRAEYADEVASFRAAIMGE